MKYLKMKITASLLAAACLTGMAMPVAEAATTWQKILYGAAAIALISNYYSNLDEQRKNAGREEAESSA